MQAIFRHDRIVYRIAVIRIGADSLCLRVEHFGTDRGPERVAVPRDPKVLVGLTACLGCHFKTPSSLLDVEPRLANLQRNLSYIAALAPDLSRRIQNGGFPTYEDLIAELRRRLEFTPWMQHLEAP